MIQDARNFIDGLEPWIRSYSYFLVAMFLLGLAALVAGSLSAFRKLAYAARELGGISAADSTKGASEQSYRALMSMVERLPDAGGTWWPVVHSTIVKFQRHDGAKAVQNGYFVTERVEETISGAKGNGEGWLAVAHAVPGVLTSLGLLGTFVALLIGLKGLQKNPLDGTWAIDPLVENLSGKFVTSIVALALSVVFVLLELGTRSTLARARHQVISALSRVLPFLSPSILLVELQQESIRRSVALDQFHQISANQSTVLSALHAVNERQLTQLERFNTDLAVSIGSAMDARIVPALDRLLQSTNQLHEVQSGLGEELLKQVADKISGAVSGAAGEEMRSMGDAIKESVRSLNEAAQAMRDGQSKLVEVTSAIIGQMNESFGDNSKKLSDATEKAVLKVVEQMDSAAGDFSAKIGGASQDVAAALLTTSTNLQKVVDECQRIVENTETTVQRFDDLVVNVSVATEDIVTAHTALKATAQPLQNVAERTATLVGSLTRGAEVISAAAQSLDTTSENLKEVQQTLASSWEDYGERFAEVDTSLGNSLQQLIGGFDLYAEKIGELNAGLDTHLSKALSDLSGVINELHESVEDLQETTQTKVTTGRR